MEFDLEVPNINTDISTHEEDTSIWCTIPIITAAWNRRKNKLLLKAYAAELEELKISLNEKTIEYQAYESIILLAMADSNKESVDRNCEFACDIESNMIDKQNDIRLFKQCIDTLKDGDSTNKRNRLIAAMKNKIPRQNIKNIDDANTVMNQIKNSSKQRYMNRLKPAELVSRKNQNMNEDGGQRNDNFLNFKARMEAKYQQNRPRINENINMNQNLNNNNNNVQNINNVEGIRAAMVGGAAPLPTPSK